MDLPLRIQISQVISANKVFIVGEYDWNTAQGDPLSSFLATLEQNSVAGDLYWSLFPHDDQHGFVQQNEHFTLHYPGNTSDMRWRIGLLRAHAYEMHGQSVPLTAPPGTPSITGVRDHAIGWHGAFGADTYTVERSTQGANGPWTAICNHCATDNNTPWIDRSTILGPAWYRVQGYSISGIPGPFSAIYQISQ